MTTAAELIPTKRHSLFNQRSEWLETAYSLNREVENFQSNKNETIYCHFKYKKDFSSSLEKYFLKKYSLQHGKCTDPFAGVGSTMFTGQKPLCQFCDITLLPVHVVVKQTRDALHDMAEVVFRGCVS